MKWLLILYFGMQPDSTPQFIIKPFNTNDTCMYYAGQIDVNERLNDNYGVWWECVQRP